MLAFSEDARSECPQRQADERLPAIVIDYDSGPFCKSSLCYQFLLTWFKSL